MKKFLVIILLLIIPFSNYSIIAVASTKYARIEKSTHIYKNMVENNNIENIICIGEKTYFVEIIANYDNFFKVNYNGISGFVKKTDVKEITNIPSTPYPINIKLSIQNTCNLRSTPTTKSDINNVVTTLNTNESDFIFIGRVFSEEAIDFGGSTWYFVNYKGKYGYIYNKYIKSISPIFENTEEVTYIQNKIEKIDNPITHTPSLIIIIVLSIPLIATLFLMYLPPKKHKSKSIKVSKNIENY